MRLLNVSLCVCVRCRTHTCLVGEKTSLCTLADRRFDCIAKATADDRLRNKGILEDKTEGFGNRLDVNNKNDRTEKEIQNRHKGNDLLRNRCNTLNTAKENECADQRKSKTYRPNGDNGNSRVDRACDGVRLYHSTHKAERKDQSDGEECGKDLAKAAAERLFDVVNRTAENRTVLTLDARFLREHSLGINGSHAEEGNNPHPEDRTGTADKDRAARADDVTRTNLRRNCRSQSLEGRKTALLLAAAEGDLTENLLHTLAKAANLNEFRSDGVKKTHTDQKEDQNVVS